MHRCLVVANQTLGGAHLLRVVRDRVDHDRGRFYIVVPTIEPSMETRDWDRGLSITERDWIDSGMQPSPEVLAAARRREAMVGPAHSRAESRLTQMIQKIESVGGRAEGEVGGPDPATAVEDALQRLECSEVIISTLPAGISSWLKTDLPERISSMTDAPVTTIEADP